MAAVIGHSGDARGYENFFETMKRNNNSNKRAPKGSRKPMRELISHPPQLNGIELRHGVTMRFITTGACDNDITFQNLLDTYLVGTGAATVAQVFQSVKIRRVQVWALPAIGGASAVSVEFSGATAGIVGDQVIHTDVSMGVQPAHVSCRPSKRALAAEFQLSSTAIAMHIVCPTGSVVDCELTFHGQFGASTAAQNAGVSTSAGVFYLRGLDGLATATTKFKPDYTPAAN